MAKSKKQTAGDTPKSKTEADLFAAFTDFCKVVFKGLTLPDKSGGRTVDCYYVDTLNKSLAEISSNISNFLETDNTGGTDKRLWEHSLMALWGLSDNVRSKGTDSFYFERNQKITAEKIARVENAWQLLKAEQPGSGAEIRQKASEQQSQKNDGQCKVKEPSKEAIQAYNFYYGTGETQEGVAKTMTDRLKKPVNQGQVSRWVNQYKKWRDAEGIPIDDTRPNIIVNSNILDVGARTDGRTTGDPRHKKNIDYKD
jgi:hypothetical protein